MNKMKQAVLFIRRGKEFMDFKRAFCLLLAVLLTGASVLLLFPEWLFAIAPELDLSGTIISLDKLGISHFPFYAGNPSPGGVSDAVSSLREYVVYGKEPLPDIGGMLLTIYQRADFLQQLYSLLIISLITIPVYMLVRLIVYDSVYAIADQTVFPLRLLLRGVFASSVSLVTVFLTWFLYRTVIFDRILTFLMEKVESFTNIQFALNATNILMIVVIGIAVIALLRATLFRGSIFSSILGAVLRSALFIVIVAAIDMFSLGVTLRGGLFILAFFFAVGILKTILLPEKKAPPVRRRKRA